VSDQSADNTEHLRGKSKSHVRVGDHERPRLDHMLYTDPGRAPDTIGIDPEDGMPRPVPATSLEDSLAPGLAPETFVCMADKTTFVIRDAWGVVVPNARFTPDQVERMPDGRYRVSFWFAIESGVPITVALRVRDGRWCVVEPLRPQCQHYRRQLVPPGNENPGLRVGQTIRYCTAIRDENGEYIDLSNSELSACEMRLPPTKDCTPKLDAADDERVRLDRKNQEQNADFDVDGELAKEAGGIFSPEGR
jgi:hypothetical protein